MKQSKVFLESEGDAWHERNKDKPRLPDPVIQAIKAAELQPKYVLELGCGNGWRLVEIEKIWCSDVIGYDASAEAIESRVCPTIFQEDILQALQETWNATKDTIIFGFCLYLVGREDLMMIAAHTDRVLKDYGCIIIHDFIPDYPYRRAYKHKEGVWSYKMDYSKLWLANPCYRMICETTTGDDDDRVGVIVLQKVLAKGWPERTE